jgi:hypothetical protein
VTLGGSGADTDGAAKGVLKGDVGDERIGVDCRMGRVPVFWIRKSRPLDSDTREEFTSGSKSMENSPRLICGDARRRLWQSVLF